jgi:general secretion pathway protein A
MQAFRRREAVVVVTGEIGTGKTVLCRTVLQRLPRRTFLSVITDPLLSSGELLQQVLEDFGILSKDHSGGEQPSQHQLVRTLAQFLASLVPLQAHAVIMIDEAQHMRPEVLEQIRLLSNFETDNSKLLQIVLVGQPDLSALLARPELRQLEQRITHRTELLPLEAAEIEYYIERRLWIAHGSELDPTADEDRVRFLPAAMAAVAVCSRGLPRVVNLLCDRALEDAFHRRKKVVDLRAVLNAADDLQIPVPRRIRFQPYRWAAAAAAAAVLGAGIWFGARASGWNLPTKAATTAPAAATDAAPGPPASTPPVAAVPTPEAGPLRDGEAFSVLVASFRTRSRATLVNEQVTSLGLPGYVRAIPGDWQQVLVGPFASRDEAQEALDRLTAGQLKGGSIVSAPAADTEPAPSPPDQAIARVRLLPATGRASLVIDLGEDAS